MPWPFFYGFDLITPLWYNMSSYKELFTPNTDISTANSVSKPTMGMLAFLYIQTQNEIRRRVP